MTDYGYVSLILDTEKIKSFQDLLQKICAPDDLYYSEWVHGDVTEELHLTLFYGLINEKLDKEKLQSHLDSIKVKSLKLGKIVLIPGYQNQYQVLMIEVLDDGGELKRIHESFKQYDFEPSVQHPQFRPHLTLAYLKPDFKFKNAPIVSLSEINVSEIKYNES
jgi:2'-5' RNA ligase